MKRQVAWIAYPDGIDKVFIIRRGVQGKNLLRPIGDAVLVEDEEGDRFIIELDKLYDDPVSASIASADLRLKYGLDEDTDDDDE